METSKVFKAEIKRILGLYDFIGAPKTISPYHAENEHPGIVDVHESIHRDLTVSTTTGVCIKLLILIHHKCHSELDLSFIDSIESTSQILIESSIKVHEGTATYLPSLAFARDNPVEAHDWIAKLPTFYRKAMAILENCIGKVHDVASIAGGNYIAQPVVLGIAKTCLSPPCMEFCNGSKYLDKLKAEIIKETPDERFKILCEHFVATKEINNLMELSASKWQESMGCDWNLLISSQSNNDHEKLDVEKLFRSLSIVSDCLLERIVSIARTIGIQSSTDVDILGRKATENLDAWKKELKTRGSSGLDGLEIRDRRSLPIESDLDSEYVVPKADRFLPNDTSYQFKFQNKDESLLPVFIDKAQQEEYLTFLNTIPIPQSIREGESLFRLKCMVLGYFWPKLAAHSSKSKEKIFSEEWEQPFDMTVPLEQVLNFTASCKKFSVGIKIDQRMFDSLSLMDVLSDSEVPVFVTCFDSSIENIIRIVDSLKKQQNHVNLSLINLGKPGAIVIVISLHSSLIHWVTLISPIIWNWLKENIYKNDPLVRIRDGLSSNRASFWSELNWDEEFIHGLTFTTYCL